VSTGGVEFRVLGPLDVSVDGEPIELTAPRPRALLAALILRGGSVVPAESLAEALWSGSPPASAASVLRVYVTQVRRALGDGRVVTRAPGYQLVVEDGELDAHRFEQLLGDGRRALADGNPRLARSLLARALELWRGDALSDVAAEGFVRDEAARLDDLRLACLESRLDADLQLGRHDGVLAELEQLVSAHPLRERLRGQLMLALYRAGRQADALEVYRAGRAVLVEELGLEPGKPLRELERRILEQDPALDADLAERRPARLPVPSTRTVGRDRELSAVVRRLLDPGTRLLTLLGPGGIGKTRLAVEAAHRLDDELADGAVLVDLAPVADPALVLPAIGRALGLREGPEPWPEALAAHLREVELLLVLDNLEHLVDATAPLGDLLAAAPRLTVLATSRRVLRLAAEEIFEVNPLDRSASLELLAERVVAALARSEPERASLDAISSRLEGLPLAIELAAPWFRTLPADEVLERLDSRLQLLAGGARDQPARQRTMRSALDWSYELLDPGAQHLLGRLSIFSGGCSTDAALAVGGPAATIEHMAALVDSSFLRRADDRYELLDLVREYACELASADDEGRGLHARYFLSLAEEAEGHLTGAEQGTWLAVLETEHDNCRVALDWAAREDDREVEVRLAAALGRFWYVRGYLGEGLERLQRAADRAPADRPELRARALRAASAVALLRGDYPLARDLAERGLDAYREAGDELGVARCLSNLGAILHAENRLDEAAATLDACVEGCLGLGEVRLLALARNNRGDVALSQGDLDTAAAQFGQSLDLLRSLGDVANIARALYNLGAVALEQGRGPEGAGLLLEALDLSREIEDDEDTAWCLIGLAASAAAGGDALGGAQLLGFATGLLERIGATMKPFEQRLYDRTLDRLRDALGADRLDDARAEGRQLVVDEIVALARSCAATGER